MFEEKTVIRESWIDGKRYTIKPLPEVDPRGKWDVRIAGIASTDSIILNLKGEPEALQSTLKRKKETKLTSASLSASRLAVAFNGDSVGFSGLVRMTALLAKNPFQVTASGLMARHSRGRRRVSPRSFLSQTHRKKLLRKCHHSLRIFPWENSDGRSCRCSRAVCLSKGQPSWFAIGTLVFTLAPC